MLEMKKKEIVLNGKKLVIMQQPTKTIIEWERKYASRGKDNDLVGYAKKILSYPTGVNPTIEEIFEMDNKITVGEVELAYNSTEEYLKNVVDLFKEGWSSPLFCGGAFLEKAGKNVNDYHRKEVFEIGKQVTEKIRFIFELGRVVDTFQAL